MQKFHSIHYIHFDTLESTNTWVKQNAHTLDPHQLSCITAQEQTAGRGRSLRKWISPKGQNIYATLFFCMPQATEIVANLGQVMTLACAKVLKKNGFNPYIKWPNDLLLEGKKTGGILCEAFTMGNQIGVAIGIGINVNMTPEMLAMIDQPATSLAQLSGHTWTLEQILDPVLMQFATYLSTLQEHGFAPLQKEYEAFLAYKGLPITFNHGHKKIQGICQSIDSTGKLHLLLPTGEILLLSAGEILPSK
jgi:BirA family biotin operon repressor/biotin-[acetyl-CoA-carboxylase] ligase